VPYQILEEWVKALVAANPQLRENPAATAHHTPVAAIAPRNVFPTEPHHRGESPAPVPVRTVPPLGQAEPTPAPSLDRSVPVTPADLGTPPTRPAASDDTRQ